MYLDDLLENLMNLDEQTCPCEKGIPCPYFNPDLEDRYCIENACLEGMVKLVRNMVREGK